MALDTVGDAAWRNVAGPLDHAGYTDSAFPGGSLLAAEGGISAIRPEHELVAVVGGVDHDSVVIHTHIFQLLQNRSDLLVVLEHARANNVFFGASLVHSHLHVLGIGVGPDVDGGRIEPQEEGLSGLTGPVHPIEGFTQHFGINRLHALAA